MDEPAAAVQRYGLAPGAICKRLFNFATGSAILLPSHYAALSEMIQRCNANGTNHTIYVIGHASRQGHGSYDNKALSERRAVGAKKWLDERLTGVAEVKAYAEGDTVEMSIDPKEPKDRAVVLILQLSTAPRPRVLPQVEPPTPHDEPDVPLKNDIPGPFRRSGWAISSISGVIVLIPTPWGGGSKGAPAGPSLGLGGGSLSIELKRIRTGETAKYRMSGSAGSFGLDPFRAVGDLKNIVGKIWTFKPGGSFSPSALDTFGSELVVSSWVPEPVTKEAFAHFGAISSVGLSTAGVSGIVFARAPLHVPVLGPGSITAFGVFASTAVALPAPSADTFNGIVNLVS